MIEIHLGIYFSWRFQTLIEAKSDVVYGVDIQLEHKDGFFFHIHNHSEHHFCHSQSSSLEGSQEHDHSDPDDDAEEEDGQDDELDVDHSMKRHWIVTAPSK